MINRSMGPVEYGYICTLSVLWGASFFFMKVALRGFGPFTIVFLRVAGSALVLSLLLAMRGEKPVLSRELVIPLFLMGALNNMIPFSLILWGQQYVQSSVASIINASSPLFSVVLAHYMTDEERMTPSRVSGIALGFSGVALLIGIDTARVTGSALAGKLAMVLSSLSYAFAAIYGRRFRGQPPVRTAAGVLTAAAVLSLPMMLLFEDPLQSPPQAESLLAVTGLVLLSTALAFVLYFKTLERTSPTNLLLVTFLIPLSAVVLGVVVLKETLHWNAFLGMALIFAGLGVVDGRFLRKSQLPDR